MKKKKCSIVTDYYIIHYLLCRNFQYTFNVYQSRCRPCDDGQALYNYTRPETLRRLFRRLWLMSIAIQLNKRYYAVRKMGKTTQIHI